MTAKVAIIGAGISGLTSAYLLNRCCDITLFERADTIGGHTATKTFSHNGKEHAIDTGFIVYNDWTYPNFIKLLTKLGVATQPTAMGFSVSCQETGLEYAGNNLNALFAQRRNLFSPKFLRMLKDIVRFNKEALRDLKDKRISRDMTLGEYLDSNGYSPTFAHYYLVPMGAAIWSASLSAMRDFPVLFFVKFFHNHGLLNIKNRPQWRVISGGSQAYLGPLTESFTDKIVTQAGIQSIHRGANGVKIVFDDGRTEKFDSVVFATHSDQALALLADASDDEKEVLGSIPYAENSVVLHHDESLLPRRKRTWSSWNYRLNGKQNDLPVLTYDMNILQGLDEPSTYCVSLNADALIDTAKVIGRYSYAHPQFSLAGITAQDRWHDINGVNRTWFCGAYWGNGFHEDGVSSALQVAEQFGEFL